MQNGQWEGEEDSTNWGKFRGEGRGGGGGCGCGGGVVNGFYLGGFQERRRDLKKKKERKKGLHLNDVAVAFHLGHSVDAGLGPYSNIWYFYQLNISFYLMYIYDYNHVKTTKLREIRLNIYIHTSICLPMYTYTLL